MGEKSSIASSRDDPSYLSKLLAGAHPGWLLAILFLGLILRLAFILVIPTQPISDFSNYHNLAVNMVKNGVYGFGMVPSSHLSPGESFFLFIVYKAAGSTDIIYPKLVQAAMGTLNIAFIYFIAKKIFNERTALISALLMAIFPTQILFTSILATENSFTFLNLLALFLIMTIEKGDKYYYAFIFIMGASIGWAVLVRPVAVLLPLLFLTVVILKDFRISKKDAKKLAIVASIFAIGVALIVIPWCVRNYVQFDHFNISSNAGINFWIGNNEHATGTYMVMDSLINDTFGDIHDLDDFERDGMYYDQAKKYVLSHPLETLKLDIRKLRILYGSSGLGVYWSMLANGTITDPDLQSSLSAMSPTLYSIANNYYNFILILALLGVLISLYEMSKNKNYLPLVLLAYILYFSVMYSISMSDDRYNFNILPVLTIFTAYTISKVLSYGKISGNTS